MEASEVFSLSQLNETPELKLQGDSSVNLMNYSRFKYGDGRVSKSYGKSLAKLFSSAVPSESSRLVVTSSAFQVAPPAAHSLVRPFMNSYSGDARTVKISRGVLTDGDYAKMNPIERHEALSHSDIHVDGSLAGETVVLIDDVIVTGAHQEVMDEALQNAGARNVVHLYVVDATSARNHPSVESLLNRSALPKVGAITDIWHTGCFIPNARFTKHVVTADPSAVDTFVREAPRSLILWIREMILSEDFSNYETYRDGAEYFMKASA